MSTVRTQLIYNDESTVTISGTSFSFFGNTLRFPNNEIRDGVNFTTLSTTSQQSIVLRLTPGSLWIKHTASLPAPLTLLAINCGEGFVAVSSPGAADIKGVDVAMVFERPTVFSDNKRIFNTYRRQFFINGRGFLTDKVGPYKTLLKFSSDLSAEDYTVRVLNSGELEVTLVDGWRADVGPLNLVAINTRGDGAGWVRLPGDGVQVAEVQQYISVAIDYMAVKVYQSALNIEISGFGFKQGMSFVFESDLKVGVDYEMEVMATYRVKLSLKVGKKWRQEAGKIIAKSLTVDNKTYNVADLGNSNREVATVLIDPVVFPSETLYHESQSKFVVIRGTGFTKLVDTKVIIRPATPGPAPFMILSVLEDTIRLLLTGQSWLPWPMSLKYKDDAEKIALQICSIDTGAGEVTFPEPVTVGYIVKDRTNLLYPCVDGCMFSFDGVCDDGSHLPHDNSCVSGTDCTDCGGVDVIPSKPITASTTVMPPSPPLASCTNTCIYPRDGLCDDPRGTKYCELGTDCQDCGPVGADNFTRSDDDGWWDDDKNKDDTPSSDILPTNQFSGGESAPPPLPPHYVSEDQQHQLGAIFAVMCIVFAFLAPIYGAYKLFQWWHARGMNQMT
eukprot:gene24122-30432_t